MDNITGCGKRLVRDKSICDIYPPGICQDEVAISVDLPELNIYELEDGVISVNSSNIYNENTMFIERVNDISSNYANYSSGWLKEHNDKRAIAILDIDAELETGFFLGGNGCSNYYHWMIEVLPKLQFYIESDLVEKNIPLLVSDAINRIPSFKEGLKAVIENKNINLVFLNENYVYRVNKLYFINSPNNIVFNTREKISSPEFCYFRKESLDFVRNKILKKYFLESTQNGLPDKNIYERVFLARKIYSRRQYNQDEIISSLSKFSIIPVYLEDLSLNEQIKIFRNAKLIIGPSGAAWTNLIFSKKGTKAISWLPEIVKEFSVYSTLAKYRGVDMSILLTKSKSLWDYHEDYELDIDSLHKKIREFI
ncbi:MAG: glycosyltransferase family 61 protein [Ignavibacteria bacterium]|nr:glycosyltransferase family 61 protein [Ignavibacteria bacterium]